jgi:hypothetical protein
MSNQSPLFISAAEVLIHSIELFRQADERMYKIIVLHAANVAELLLQDRLIDTGESIYETGKSSRISIWKVLETLRKLRLHLPERAILEGLFEDRESIQYRPGAPTLKTVYYYMDAVTAFFKRFARDEYGIDLADVLRELGIAEGNLQLLGVLEGEGNELAFLEALFNLSQESAVIQAFKFLEGKFAELFFVQQGYYDLKTKKPLLLSHQPSPEFEQLLESLIDRRFLTRKMIGLLEELRAARNYAVYRTSPMLTPPDWVEMLEIARKIMFGLNKALKAAAEGEFEGGVSGTDALE